MHNSEDSPGSSVKAAPLQGADLAEALKLAPIGAALIAGIAVAVLLAGWLAFYFLLFLPRGAIG